MNAFMFRPLCIAAAAILFSSFALSQTVVTVPLEPTLSTSVRIFECKKSFSGTGVGVCEGLIIASFRNAQGPIRESTLTCDVTLQKHIKKGKDISREYETFRVSKRQLEHGTDFTDIELSFKKDLTSLISPVDFAYVMDNRCTINTRY